jgi:peroxiredoxin
MECVSLDCPIYYERVGSNKDVEDVTTLQAFVDELMRERPTLAESAGMGSRRESRDVAVVIDGTDW